MEFSLAASAAVLERTPRVLGELLSGLPEGWTELNEGGASWCPFDIIGHLIHGEKTDWIPRLRIILAHGEAQPFPPFDREAQFTESADKTLERLLDEFTELRSSNVSALRAFNLTDGDLDRRGTHPAFGPVTARQLLATWTVHDLNHIAQIARVMAHQYHDAVGPWVAYLGILQRQRLA